MKQSKLTIVPITQKEAKAFVKLHHRHLPPPVGSIFQIAVANKEGKIVGVLMAGRPIARYNQDGYTMEINRCATDGTPNACSALLGAAWRVAKNMGYRKIITFTHKEESGASLRAVNWKIVGEVTKQSVWHRTRRPTVDTTDPIQEKFKWEKTI